MTNDELGKAILDANKQASELFGSSDVKKAVDNLNNIKKLITPGIESNKPATQYIGGSSLANPYESIAFRQAIEALDKLSGGIVDLKSSERGTVGNQEKLVVPPFSQAMLKEENDELRAHLSRNDEQIAETRKGILTVNLKLTRQIEIGHLLQRVHEKTHAQFMEGNIELIDRLIPITTPEKKAQPTPAFLLSIDIRRSTDLMLNAKDASYFADFLDELSRGLANIIKGQFGIFDKFTGDGALAFFPVSFSGTSAASSVLVAAEKAHAFFSEHYKAHRGSFNSILVETGLGIGIDYGDVNILRLSDGLTAVGKPVVYASRFSGVEAGKTAVNQSAYEMMRAADDKLEFEEIDVEIKHQGKHLAYRPKNSPRSELIKEPEWFSASPTSVE